MNAVLLTDHHFYYQPKHEITARRLADSLLGLDEVAKQAARVLSRLLDMRIENAEVLIETFQRGSYSENFLVRILFGKGKNLEGNIEKLRKKLGIEKFDTKKAMSTLIAGIIVYGAYQFASKGDAEAQYHIENTYNILAPNLGMNGQDFERFMEANFKDKERLKHEVVRIVRPNRSPDVGDMELDGIIIPQEALRVVPPQYPGPRSTARPSRAVNPAPGDKGGGTKAKTKGKEMKKWHGRSKRHIVRDAQGNFRYADELLNEPIRNLPPPSLPKLPPPRLESPWDETDDGL